MLSVARITATRAITKTCPRAAAAAVGSRNMVGFSDSMKSKVRPLGRGSRLVPGEVSGFWLHVGFYVGPGTTQNSGAEG